MSIEAFLDAAKIAFIGCTAAYDTLATLGDR
jgi:hypothetical protein